MKYLLTSMISSLIFSNLAFTQDKDISQYKNNVEIVPGYTVVPAVGYGFSMTQSIKNAKEVSCMSKQSIGLSEGVPIGLPICYPFSQGTKYRDQFECFISCLRPL